MESFEALRPRLFAIAYRMVGTVMDAEDILQEVYLRWQATDQMEVASPEAFLTTMVTRLAIDHLRSAQVKREQYVGPWLPEPVLDAPAAGVAAPDTEEHLLLTESLSTAFLVLLEALNPLERAIFLLHDVFDYDFAEVAAIVGKSEANCRQIARRARAAITERRPRFAPSPGKADQLLQQFMHSCETGDLPGLVNLLAGDVVLWTDSGGKVTAARHPVAGAKKVASLLLGLTRRLPPASEVRRAPVNGQPGLVYLVEGELHAVFSFDYADDRIQVIHVIVNPDKLRHVADELGVPVRDPDKEQR
jgi:RNA polymerase sigma-70 factor (ECF subfamily)